MADSIWASIKPDWHDQGRCSGIDLKIFEATFYPANEDDADALRRVQGAYCNGCPVRGKCLNSAIINKDWGFWAGTTRAQRMAMARTRSRAKCPLCASVNLVAVDPYEVCIRCGASWRAGSRPASRDGSGGS